MVVDPLHTRAEAVDDVCADFLSLFPLPPPSDPRVPLQVRRVAYLAKKGQVPLQLGRSLVWRILLGLLPCDEDDTSGWEETTLKHRAMYEALKARVFPDIADSASDPLNSASGSSWDLYYRNMELMNEIKTDLERLYPNNCDDYFMQPKRQEVLANVLLVWARQHEDVAYRQGMHELLAPMMLSIEADCENLRTVVERHPHVKEQHRVIGLILDEANLEADCYWMFDVVMREVRSVFVPKPEEQLADPFRPDVRELCDQIQQSVLHKIDPKLADHLQEEGVQSQLYGMKWARLLFAREFCLRDMLVLWDFLFAGLFEGHTLLDMVACVSAGMIHLERDTLLDSDVHGCLSRLMRYPGVSKIENLIELSSVIQSDPESLRRSSSKLDRPVKPGNATSSAPSSAVEPTTGTKPSWLLSAHRRQPSSTAEAAHPTSTGSPRAEAPSNSLEEGSKNILTRMSQTVADAATRLRGFTVNAHFGHQSVSVDELHAHNEGIAIRLARIAELLRSHDTDSDDALHEVVTRLTTLSSSLTNSRPLSEYDEAFGDPPVQVKVLVPMGAAAVAASTDTAAVDSGNAAAVANPKPKPAPATAAPKPRPFVDPLSGFVQR